MKEPLSNHSIQYKPTYMYIDDKTQFEILPDQCKQIISVVTRLQILALYGNSIYSIKL